MRPERRSEDATSGDGAAGAWRALARSVEAWLPVQARTGRPPAGDHADPDRGERP